MDFEGYSVIGLACIPDPEALKQALAQFFNLDPAQIFINTEGAWWEKDYQDSVLVCDAKLTGGDFPTSLEFIIYDASIKPPQTLSEVAEFCALVNCTGIVEDASSLSPYTWVVVEPDGHTKAVFVDSDRLDIHDELVIDPESSSYDTQTG